METKKSKKHKFIDLIYRELGNFFATLFFFLIALLGAVLIVYFFDWIYNILYLFKEVIPVLLGFVIGYLLARWR